MTKPARSLVGAVLLAGVLTGCATGGQNNPQSTPKGTAMNPAISQLQNAEQIWVRALVESNADLLTNLIDDEFSFIGPDGQFEDRAAYLAGYRALPRMGVAVESVDMDDVKIRVLGDTGVVTGHVVAKVKVQGQQIVEDVRFTRIYQRRGETWRMVAGQGTRLPAKS
jgi:ketosteroid isomerase-like protein